MGPLPVSDHLGSTFWKVVYWKFSCICSVLSFFSFISIICLDGVALNQQGSSKKRLINYCLYGWGAPAFIVSICVTIDQTLKKEYYIGYGKWAEWVLLMFNLKLMCLEARWSMWLIRVKVEPLEVLEWLSTINNELVIKTTVDL